MATITKAIGAALQELRLERRLSLIDVSDVVGCHNSTITKMERGERLTHPRVHAYAQCLGVPYHKVVERAEELMRE